MSGDVFDQNRGLNKQEERDFLKQGDIDQIKQEVGGDLQKLEKTIITNYHSENFDKIGEQKIAQIKDVVGEDFYNQNYKLKKGGAKGISALQIMAIKCVDILNGEKVENILKSKYIPSWPVDGILGPNTLYMLKEISKTDLGGDPIPEWNGVIDNNLLNKMLNICGIQKDGTDDKIEKKETTSEEITPVIQEEVETPTQAGKDIAEEEEEKVVPKVEDGIQQEQPEEIPQNPEETATVRQEEPVEIPKPPVEETPKKQEEIVAPKVDDEQLESGFVPLDGIQQEQPEEIPQNPEEIAPVIQEEVVETPKPPVEETSKKQEEIVAPKVDDEQLESGFVPLDPSQQEQPKKQEKKEEKISPVIQEEVVETPPEQIKETPKKQEKIVVPEVEDELEDGFVPLDGIQQNESNTENNSINNNEITLEAQSDLDEAKLKANRYAINAHLYTQDSYNILSDAESMQQGTNSEVIAKVKAINDAIDNLVLDTIDTESSMEFSLDKLMIWLRKESFDSSALTYETIFNRVNAIKNKETKEKISQFLLKGDVRGMQEYLGMKDGSRYDDNRADGILGRNTLNRMSNPLFGLKGQESLKRNNVPQDLIDIYKRFERNEKENKKGADNKEYIVNYNNNGLSYAIISKSDFNMYIFDSGHKLITAHPVGLGKTRGDQKNEAYKGGADTTPGGMYEVDVRKDYPNEYAGPGEYVALNPKNGQYDANNSLDFTLGYHNYFIGNGVGNTRKKLLQALGLDGRRMSNGCINTLSEGSIYDNLGFGSKVYVTFESK